MSGHASIKPDLTHGLFTTAPPDEPVETSRLGRFKQLLAAKLSALIMPVVKKAAAPYLGGETVEEALCVARRLGGEGYAVTLGYWDTGQDTAEAVAEVQADAIRQLTAQSLDGTLSLKPPALHYAPELAARLAAAAAEAGLRLHCDSHGVEAADPSNAMLEAMIARLGAARLGTTLPGRWRRSLSDADWAVAQGLNVRVVKGQWPDPADPGRDMAEGFLAVIERLAGRARHVAVATHDTKLAMAAIARLQAAGTACELELLFGMPAKALLRWAAAKGVGRRVYVPFGAGFVPNAVRVLRRNPRLVLAVGKDRLAAAAAFLASPFRS